MSTVRPPLCERFAACKLAGIRMADKRRQRARRRAKRVLRQDGMRNLLTMEGGGGEE